MNFELEEIIPSFISLGFGFFQVKPTLPWSPLFSVMMLTLSSLPAQVAVVLFEFSHVVFWW